MGTAHTPGPEDRDALRNSPLAIRRTTSNLISRSNLLLFIWSSILVYSPKLRLARQDECLILGVHIEGSDVSGSTLSASGCRANLEQKRRPTCSYFLSILVTNSALERPFLNSSVWKSGEVGLGTR